MTRFICFRPLVLLALGLGFSIPRASAQENTTAPPAPETFLKIINEQIAAMANSKFEMVFLSGPRTTTVVAPRTEALFDENGNPLTAGSPGAPALTPNFKIRAQLAGLLEYHVIHTTLDEKPTVEHISHPQKGHFRIFHSSKDFVTSIKNPTGFILAFAILPMTVVEHYRIISSSLEPSSLTWAVESHDAGQTTIVLRAQSKLKMRLSFAHPSKMCTSLVIFDDTGAEEQRIEAVPGATIPKFPFLAASYRQTLRGYPRACEITFAGSLDSSLSTAFQKPKDYTEITYDEFKRRLDSAARARAREMERQRNRR